MLPDLHFLEQTLNHTKIPPLHQWQSSECVDFDIVITQNGEWYHEGRLITRQALVNVFASVLWAEPEGDSLCHYLKTPTHLYRIRVEDAPLIINRIEHCLIDNQVAIVFFSSTNDSIVLDDDHVPFFGEFNHYGTIEHRLYIPVRHRLIAKITRSAFYHLVQLGQLDGKDGNYTLTLTSLGKNYTLDSKDNLC